MKKNLFSKKVNNKSFHVHNEQSEYDHGNFWDKIFNVKTFGIMWGFLIGICIIAFFDIRVFASDVTDSLQFPLQFEDAHALNNWYSDVYQTLNGDSNISPLINDEDYVIVPVDLSYYGYWDDWSYWNIFIVAVPIDTFSDFNTNALMSQTSLNANYITNKDSYIFKVWIDERGNYPITISDFETFDPTNRQYFGAHNSQPFYNYTFVANYPVSWNKNFYSNTDKLTLKYEMAVSDLGHAIEPNLNDDNIDDIEKPDIDDYLPTLPNQPTIDNSTLETLVESLINWLKWAYNGLTGTIKGFLQYIGDTITYSAQKIIDNIKNGINNLYQNFKSLFEPVLNGIVTLLNGITSKLDYISQPFDSSVLSDAFEETAIYSDIDSISQLTEDSFGVWSNTAEPNSFAIPLHTEQIYIDGHALTSNVQYIDFGVIDSVKTPIRAVMWCLVTFGLLYTIIDSIPNYIGGNDE